MVLKNGYPWFEWFDKPSVFKWFPMVSKFEKLWSSKMVTHGLNGLINHPSSNGFQWFQSLKKNLVIKLVSYGFNGLINNMTG